MKEGLAQRDARGGISCNQLPLGEKATILHHIACDNGLPHNQSVNFNPTVASSQAFPSKLPELHAPAPPANNPGIKTTTGQRQQLVGGGGRLIFGQGRDTGTDRRDHAFPTQRDVRCSQCLANPPGKTGALLTAGRCRNDGDAPPHQMQ